MYGHGLSSQCASCGPLRPPALPRLAVWPAPSAVGGAALRCAYLGAGASRTTMACLTSSSSWAKAALVSTCRCAAPSRSGFFLPADLSPRTMRRGDLDGVLCRSQWEETRESKPGLMKECAGLRMFGSRAHAHFRMQCPLPSTCSSARVCPSDNIVRRNSRANPPISVCVCVCVCVCVFASMPLCMRTHAHTRLRVRAYSRVRSV